MFVKSRHSLESLVLIIVGTDAFPAGLFAALVTADAVHELDVTPYRQWPGRTYRRPPEEGTDNGALRKPSACPECSAGLKLGVKRLAEPYATEE